MSETLELLTEGDLYKVLRLVMVNSGSAAYVEIPIDQTAALLSKNNKGKTSALNALKLFLLPEVNFKSCESKFGFASGGTVYSGLESFQYYFPSPNSYIILEAENVRGKFCIVLHQKPKEELGYGRIAVPEAYEFIRHLFWDRGASANQGMGQHPADFTLSTVQKSLLNLKGVILGDQEAIRSALYTRYSPTKPETQFCLMPLVQQPRAAMMRSIKALLQLSFDIKGADTKNLPLAIANIIDCDVSTGREPIHIDFKKIQSDRQRLRQDADHLHKVKGHKDDWVLLVKTHKRYDLLRRQWTENCARLEQSIAALLDEHEPLYVEAKNHYHEICAELERVQGRRKDKKDQLTQKKYEKKTLEKDTAKLEQSIGLAEDTMMREKPLVPHGGASAVANYLRELKVEYERKLDNLQDKNKASTRVEELVREKVALKAAIQNVEARLASGGNHLLSSLSEHSATVLNSINPNFKRIKFQPMAEHTKAVDEFAELFSAREGKLEFCNQPLEKTPVQVFHMDALIAELEADLNYALKRQQDCEKEIQQLTQLLKSGGPLKASIIEEQKAEIEEIEKELKALGAYDRDREDLEEKRLVLAAVEETLEQLVVAEQALQEELLALTKKEEHARRHFESVQADIERVKDANKQLQTTKNFVELNAGDMGQITLETAELLHVAMLPEALRELDLYYREYREKRQKTLDHFRTLIGIGIVAADPDMAHRSDLESLDFADVYQRLRSEFDNVDTKEKEHLSQVRNHNHETSAEISVLDSMARAISNFEDKINSELGGIKISNLSSVRIQIKTLEGFNTLRTELINHGTTSDQLMHDSFYLRLADFCEKYLNDSGGYGKLDLEKIVKDVRFIYEINGKQESTSQSNGTNGMVNAVLLSILMRRLVPEDVRFTLPVVFDEIGSLDEDNLPELRRVVETNHFVLLVANPNNNGYIARHIGRWHDIYLHQLSEGKVVNKCLALYLADTEYLQTHSQLNNDRAGANLRLDV